MNGYVLLKRGKGGAGECGILSQPSYPVISGSPGPVPPSPSHTSHTQPPEALLWVAAAAAARPPRPRQRPEHGGTPVLALALTPGTPTPTVPLRPPQHSPGDGTSCTRTERSGRWLP